MQVWNSEIAKLTKKANLSKLKDRTLAVNLKDKHSEISFGSENKQEHDSNGRRAPENVAISRFLIRQMISVFFGICLESVWYRIEIQFASASSDRVAAVGESRPFIAHSKHDLGLHAISCSKFFVLVSRNSRFLNGKMGLFADSLLVE